MIDLDELERLDKEGASAPWWYSPTYNISAIKADNDEYIADVVSHTNRPNAPLIVATRNALAELIAESRAWREHQKSCDRCHELRHDD